MLRTPLKLAPSELTCLQPCAQLCGEIITAYLRLVERRSRSWGSRLPSVWAIDTVFLQDWQRCGWEKTKKRTADANLRSQDLLLFPIHHPTLGFVGTGRWWLLGLNAKRFRPSTPWETPAWKRRVVSEISSQLSSRRPVKAQWRIEGTSPDRPRQTDGVSCGVYVCKFADKLWRAQHVKDSPIYVTRPHKVIAGVLRRQQFDLENFFANETPGLMAHRRFTSSRLDLTPHPSDSGHHHSGWCRNRSDAG